MVFKLILASVIREDSSGMKKKKLTKVFLILLLLLPLWMWLCWFFTPKHKLLVAIIDKTVLNTDGQEHISLSWILNNSRYTKTSTKSYTTSRDYFGFFPLKNERFKIKGLERFSNGQLQQLSDDADVVYLTDTYGIYKNEWYSQKGNLERSGILYGGMSQQDITFLQDMKARHKLIITEFNTIASPTPPAIRNQFEKCFGMHWTGWVARYFNSFDTAVNKELPHWLVNNYKAAHKNQWPFHKSGIAFVDDNDVVVILEDSTHLNDPVPHIHTARYGQEHLSLPALINYPFWFDVIIPDLTVNHAISRFIINTNDHGTDELKKHGIPLTFPAILMHNDKDYQFYYFSGDFCDNPIKFASSYFKGIAGFKWFFYNSADQSERESFFWNFYLPMVKTILQEKVQ
jgi:hypothetical protein